MRFLTFTFLQPEEASLHLLLYSPIGAFMNERAKIQQIIEICKERACIFVIFIVRKVCQNSLTHHYLAAAVFIILFDIGS